MDHLVNMQYVVNSLVFSGLGMVLLVLAFVVIDIITPHYSVWKEVVERQNTALAILLGAFLIGIAMIISAAVHG